MKTKEETNQLIKRIEEHLLTKSGIYSEDPHGVNDDELRGIIKALKWTLVSEPVRVISFTVKKYCYDIEEKAKALLIANKKDFQNFDIQYYENDVKLVKQHRITSE